MRQRRLSAAGLADHPGRNAGDGGIAGHILKHHGACRDARAAADV